MYLVRRAVARIDSIADGAPSLVLLISIVCPKFIVRREAPGTFKQEGHRSVSAYVFVLGGRGLSDHPLSIAYTLISRG